MHYWKLNMAFLGFLVTKIAKNSPSWEFSCRKKGTEPFLQVVFCLVVPRWGTTEWVYKWGGGAVAISGRGDHVIFCPSSKLVKLPKLRIKCKLTSIVTFYFGMCHIHRMEDWIQNPVKNCPLSTPPPPVDLRPVRCGRKLNTAEP